MIQRREAAYVSRPADCPWCHLDFLSGNIFFLELYLTGSKGVLTALICKFCGNGRELPMMAPCGVIMLVR